MLLNNDREVRLHTNSIQEGLRDGPDEYLVDLWSTLDELKATEVTTNMIQVG